MKCVFNLFLLVIGLYGLNAGQKFEKVKRPEIYSLHIVSDIKYRFATTKVTSRVKNSDERSREAIFDVTLPNEAFITNLTLEIDGKIVVGEIKEKEEARAQYDAARQRGESAGYIGTKIPSLISKDQKENIICTMDDVRGDFLGPPYGTTPAAVIANGNKKSREHINEKGDGPYRAFGYFSLFSDPIDFLQHGAKEHRETNKFNLAITVAPLSKVSFNLTYQELLKRKHGLYEQVIYIDPGQPVHDMHVEVSILETREITNLVVPPLRNDVDHGMTETGEMSYVHTEQTDKTAYIKYFPSVEEQTATSQNGISGQFVVKYDVDREMDGGDLLVVNGYFVHFFAPKGFSPIPKDVLFVLDTSGSMHGTKITQLKQAMESILDELNEGDRINILTFASSTSFWKTEMVEITGPDVIEEAKAHVNSLTPGGWTNIERAVTQGIGELVNRDTDITEVRSPVLVFLTDGEPTKGITDKDKILESVRASNEVTIPIFSLAFGHGADYDLVKKLSAQNAGFARKIYEASDADKQISGFYKEISVTLLNDVTFTYLDADVSNVTETKFPYFFEGSETIIAGRMITAELLGSLVLRSEIEANSVEGIRILQTNALEEDSEFSHMKNLTGPGDYEKITEKVWAYLTIKELLKKELATDNPELKKGYNRRVLELSLRYGFVTPLTSMVVTLPEAKPEVDDIDYFEETEYDEPVLVSSKRKKLASRHMTMPSGVMDSPPVFHSPPMYQKHMSPLASPIYRAVIDFPMKVKFSNIEKPLCYGLKNEEQYQNGTEATYLLYSDPRTGANVTINTTMGEVSRWRKVAVIKSVTIETANMTMVITRDTLENGIYRKTELSGLVLVIQGSARFDDGLTVYFEGVNDEQPMASNGILAKIMSKKFSLKKEITILSKKTKKGKRKRQKTPLKRGLFKVMGEKKFIGVLMTLPDQAFAGVGSTCWDVQKQEASFFDMNEFRVVT